MALIVRRMPEAENVLHQTDGFRTVYLKEGSPANPDLQDVLFLEYDDTPGEHDDAQRDDPRISVL